MKPFIQRLHPSLLKEHLDLLGTDEAGQNIILKKSRDFVFKIFDLPLSAMHILKQEALSVGADLATPKEAILCQKSHYDGILLGSFSQIHRIMQKCLTQPFGLKPLAHTLKSHLTHSQDSHPAQLMAILNLTPDSFFEGSRFSCQDALKQIQKYIELGVEIIDIGGASSRPQSSLIEPDEELHRLKDLILLLKQNNIDEKVKLSIDTYNPQVADFALSNGFKILNDILGFNNPLMLEVCAKHKAEAILMHSKGTPQTMQSLAKYENLFREIDEFFEYKIKELQSFGISQITLDIGFGFAKEMSHNLALVQNLAHFKHFGFPLLVGASRKNTIGLLTNKSTEQRLSGTLALHQIALQNGADVLRIHDVEAHLDLLSIHQAMETIW